MLAANDSKALGMEEAFSLCSLLSSLPPFHLGEVCSADTFDISSKLLQISLVLPLALLLAGCAPG